MGNAFTRLFFVEDETSKQEVLEKTPNTATPTPQETVQTKTSGEINENLLNIFNNAIEQSSGIASDYYRLKRSVDGMEKAGISNEKDRYIAAYIALKSVSPIDKNGLIKSIDACIDIIMNEKNNAVQALNTKKKDKINNKEEILKQKKDAISALNIEIEKIKATIEEETKTLSLIQNEINEATIECDKNEADLNKTVEMVLKQLQNDKDKLNIILKE